MTERVLRNILEEYGRKQEWSNIKNSDFFFVERLKKTTKKNCSEFTFPRPRVKLASSEQEARTETFGSEVLVFNSSARIFVKFT